MHFCSNCSNMYYIRINSDDPNKLVYYCRKCGNEDKTLAIENVCVSKTLVKKTEQTFSHIINKSRLWFGVRKNRKWYIYMLNGFFC